MYFMQVNPGELNKRIEIYCMDSEDDDEEFPVPVKKTVRSTWASFKRTSGTEKFRSGKDMSEVQCRFLARHTLRELNTDMKILYDGATYEILYINDYEDSHRYDEIWCRKVE